MIALLLRLLRRIRDVAGQAHTVAVVAPEVTSFSSGDGCFWGAAESTSFGGVPRPVPMLSGSGTDARSKACSVDASETVLLHTLSPRHPENYWNETAAGGGYRAHLRVVTKNSFSLVVGRSNPRNRRLGRAWNTTDVNLFSHFRMHPHAETPQCRMHDSTEMYVSSGSLASVVLVEACPDNTKRAHPQASQTNILPSQITASASLTSSAGSVMGQLPIGRFADLSWILRLRANHWNTIPTRSV
ncbi:hypothetical protein TCDM_11851 [Trypanosoma cruzi Dm28c]|uniref:Trans-sialidase n=1 Tax=Trypanosoma cruzi Dm28c TaxID=1416333 RepID=V5B3U6_TRYCR|nr:hypothetical protein TCDM_11851 [Trypanosoma cruzi Dm28c]